MRKTILGGAGVLAAVLAIGAAPAHAAADWFFGTSDTQNGAQCFGGTQTGYGQNTSTTVSYWTDPNAGYPAVGDKYWVQLWTGAVGFTCPWGISDVSTEIILPDDTVPAVDPTSNDPNDRVRCFLLDRNATQWRELTNSTWTAPWDPSVKGKWCDGTTQPQKGQYGWNLGYRLLAQGAQFRVIMPVRSFKRLAGMGAPGTTSKGVGAITSGVNTIAAPYQWFTVFDRLPAVTYPAGATSAVTDTTTHTKAVVDTWYRPGKIYIDLGTGSSGDYQVTAGPFAVDGTYPQYTVDQDWTQLTPGTDHHWRARFVADDGKLATGDAQPFRTTGTAPGGGTPPPVPGGGGTGGGTTTPPPTTGGGGGGTTSPPPAGDPGGGSVDPQPLPTTTPSETTTPMTTVTPPPPPPPPPGTDDADHTPPALAVTAPRTARAALLTGAGLGLGATCTEACRLAVELRVDRRAAKRLGLRGTVLASARTTALRSGRVAVRVRVRGTAARRLRAVRGLTATVAVTATDAAGNRTVRTSKLRLSR